MNLSSISCFIALFLASGLLSTTEARVGRVQRRLLSRRLSVGPYKYDGQCFDSCLAEVRKAVHCAKVCIPVFNGKYWDLPYGHTHRRLGFFKKQGRCGPGMKMIGSDSGPTYIETGKPWMCVKSTSRYYKNKFANGIASTIWGSRNHNPPLPDLDEDFMNDDEMEDVGFGRRLGWDGSSVPYNQA